MNEYDCGCTVNHDGCGYFWFACPLHSAAPELLAALKRLLACVCDEHDDYDAVGQAMLAIVRAEGR